MNQLATRYTTVFAAMTAVIIMAFAMVMTVSAESDDPDWKQSPTGLAVTAGNAAGELDITWDAHPQTTKTLSDYRVTWTPDGEDFKPNDQTEWFAYPTTNQVTATGLDAGEAYKVRVRAKYEDAKKSNWSDVATGAAGVTQSDEKPAPEPTPDIARNHEELPLIGIDDGSAFESTINGIRFHVNLTAPASHEVTFTWATSILGADTAETGDFTAVTGGSGAILTGHEETAIYVHPIDDNFYEGDETFTVTISDVINATPVDSSATGTITENENQPMLNIGSPSATEGDDIEFIVFLTGPLTEEDVTFDYATSIESDDNSEAGDFTNTSGSGTITAGNSATTITVPTHDDGLNDASSRYEGDETFTLTISNPTLAGISQDTAKGTILDDEGLSTVKFTSSDRLTTEDAGHITNFLTFDVAPPGEQTSYISFTSSGTATAGQDYNIQNTTLTVNANVNSIATNIIMVNDNVAELDETVIITVVAASANIQVDPEFSTRTLTIQDYDEHPTLSFTSETYNVNENDGHAVLTVNKTGDSSFPLRVDYETVSRNLAIAGDDYVATSGTLTFQPAEFSKTISVPIIDNNIYRDFGQRFNVELNYSPQSSGETDPVLGTRTAVVIIINDDPAPTASMANVTANERAGTMTLTLKLSHPSSQDISYRTPDNSEYRGGTATFEVDYEIQYDGSNPVIITVPAGQLTRSFDITLIDDDLEEPDETVELVWLKVSSSQATPDEFTFTGTITDPPICDALGNLENSIVVMNLTGEITQAGQSKFHRIRLDPYRSYMIEAIGHNGEDMLGVEEHPNLTLSNPDIPTIWNARATSRWTTYGDRNDGDQPKNVIRRFLDSSYRTYKVEVNSGNNQTGTYQLKIRVNNVCRLDENENAHYQWAGGPLGYPARAPTYRPEPEDVRSCWPGQTGATTT